MERTVTFMVTEQNTIICVWFATLVYNDGGNYLKTKYIIFLLIFCYRRKDCVSCLKVQMLGTSEFDRCKLCFRIMTIKCFFLYVCVGACVVAAF
jgi:hypothetical protein